MSFQYPIMTSAEHTLFVTATDRDTPAVIIPVALLQDDSMPTHEELLLAADYAKYQHARWSLSEITYNGIDHFSETELRRFLAILLPHIGLDDEMTDAIQRIQNRLDFLGSPRKKRIEITTSHAELLVLLGERNGYQCKMCGSARHLEIDHVVPLAAGGGNELTNLQLLCQKCNRRKSARV